MIATSSGENDDFEEFWKKEEPNLRRLLYGILKNSNDADDACQEVAYEAYAKEKELEGKKLKFLAKCRAKDELRRRKRRAVSIDSDDCPALKETKVMDVRTENPKLECLKECLEKLEKTDANAQIIRMHYFDGLKFEKIAELLRKNKKTITSRARAARKKLMEMIQKLLP